MSSRKTSYVATVERIDDIEGKDLIKYVKLVDNGFQIIHNVQSTPISVGDRIVYIEYDSLIEPCEQFEFLRKRCWSERYQKLHLRAMKMSGVVSYGLIVDVKMASEIICSRVSAGKISPVHDPQIGIMFETIDKCPDGYNLSGLMGITPLDDAEEFEQKQKHQPLTKWQRFVKKYAWFLWKAFYYRKPNSSAFPSFAAHTTDETRIETLQAMFRPEYWGLPVYITIKMDGQSLTAAIWKNKFYLASRHRTVYCQPIRKAARELVPDNMQKLGRENDFIEIACKYSLPKVMNDYRRKYNLHNITVQGELCGSGIQKNRAGLTERMLYLFNLYNSDKQRYYKWEFLKNFAEESKIPTVPFVGKRLWDFKDTKELKEYAKGFYNNGKPQEGIVIRSDANDTDFIDPPKHGQANCFSLKVINDDFVAMYS